MNVTWNSRGLAWITRIVAVLYIALNAYGWWDESQARQSLTLDGTVAGDWFWQWAVLTHLIPILVMILFTALGWQRPAFGAIGFLAIAVLQAFSVGTEWVYLPLVAAPPALVALLFGVGWMLARRASRNR